MGWTIELTKSARRTFDKFDQQTAQRIGKFLHSRVAASDHPRLLGKPLQGPLRGYWKYRVGDFRLVCDIQDQRLVVLVVEIGNRRDVYR